MMFNNPGKRRTFADDLAAQVLGPQAGMPMQSVAAQQVAIPERMPMPVQTHARPRMFANRAAPAPQTGTSIDPNIDPNNFEAPAVAQEARLVDPGKIDLSGVNSTTHAKPHFFEEGGVGQKIAGILGPALLSMSAGAGNPAALMQLRQMAEAKAAEREEQTWKRHYDTARTDKIDDRDYEDNKPQYFSGGQDRLKFDPRTGSATTVYDAPTGAEAYASHFGGNDTPEYRQAMSDYTLRGWGETATDNRAELEGLRYGNRAKLRSLPTYRDLNPRPTAAHQPRPASPTSVLGEVLQNVAGGHPLSPGQTQLYQRWQAVGGGRGGGNRSAASGIPMAAASGPVRVNSPADAMRLPPGTQFMTPDGRVKVR